MSWRTVVISRRCKLDLNMGYLVVRGEEIKRVFLDEIAILIIENTAVSMTACLLNALNEQKIRVIFCNDKRNPYAELTPYYGCHDSSKKIKAQMSWSDELKGAVWTEIVAEKIRNQAGFLSDSGCSEECEMLLSYVSQIKYLDETNREGHAAKVYFNALFGKGFKRNDEDMVNSALNYGYALILSAFNREISANGYLTQLGLFHDNMFNPYNLSCDLMEPFRILVDRYVAAMELSSFGSEEKHELISILHQQILIGNAEQTVLNAIKIYVKSIFDALNCSELSLIRFARI